MAKRGRRKKFRVPLNIRPETIRSAIAIFLMLLAGVIIISSILGEYAGNFILQEVLRTVFGYSQILLAPVLFISGLVLIGSIKWQFADLRVLFGFACLLVGGSGLMHSFYSGDNALEAAKNGTGGGYLGYFISETLSNLISIYGAILVFLALIILALVLMFDKSLDELVATFKIFSLPERLKRLSRMKEQTELESEDMFGTEEEPQLEESKPEEKKPEFEIIPNLAEPTEEDAIVSIESARNEAVSTLVPTLPYSDKVYELPPLDLLDDPPNTPIDRGDVNDRKKIIEDTLRSFGIGVTVKDMKFGPTVTQYALEAEAGTKIAKISNLQYDLALALASPTGSVRIEAPIPGRSLVGIEVPNNSRAVVNFKEVLVSEAMKTSKSRLALVLGKDVGGRTLVYDIGKMPHLLIAGATGSGKSVFIHNLMFSILYRATPQECKFILIDPKRVELKHYDGIPHLLSPVVTDIDKAPSVFKWAVQEMERRYKLLEAAKVRNISDYNKKSGFQALPYILVIVDELAEIMVTDPAAVEKSIIRLAQLARAVGIHLILALQRPTTNIITGLIKANIPCRIAFNVTSGTDSRVILDQVGAEKLLGMGDMLFVPPDDSKPVRIQGAYVNDKEIARTVDFLKKTGIEPDFTEEIFKVEDTAKSISVGGDGVDDLFDEAVEIVQAEGKASASLLQRRLSIGYSRAARIIDEMEAKGIVGPQKGSKPREIVHRGTTLDEIGSDF